MAVSGWDRNTDSLLTTTLERVLAGAVPGEVTL